MDVADRYQDGLEALFDRLTEHPESGIGVAYIRAGYRRAVYKNHSVYYRIEDDEILIVRILRRQNVDDQLPN